MQAMVLNRIGAPLEWMERPDPLPGPGEIRIRISACGVCRTDLHVVDGELPDPRVPIIPGHEIVGRVDRLGSGVSGFAIGERVGVPWLGHTCQKCACCAGGHENLCDAPEFTGYFPRRRLRDDDRRRRALLLSARRSRRGRGPRAFALRRADRLARLQDRRAQRRRHPRIGLYGFGAAAHILAQVAIRQGHEVFAFTQPGDAATQDFARKLGAIWAGGSDQAPPERLDAAILFAPVGSLVPLALKAVRKGGAVVCAGIHMSDIPSFPYALLWEERQLVSVANLTRRDGLEFLRLAPQLGIATTTRLYPLFQANDALADLRAGAFDGAAVLIP